MIIRGIEEKDLEKLLKIHQEFFQDEFSFPDFTRGFFTSFVVESNGNIVTGGGIRPIAEMILVTDKSQPLLDKRLALAQALEAAEYLTKKHGFEELHVFVQNPLWKTRLLRTGFKQTRGEALVLEL